MQWGCESSSNGSWIQTYKVTEKRSNYFKGNGSKFFIAQEGSYKYEKGQNWNELHGIGLELEMLMCSHSF